MKRKITAWVLILTFILCIMPTISLPVAANMDITAAFKDANFLAAVREILGKQSTDPIYDIDVADITSLDVSNKNIADLSGIEYFSALTRLECYKNELKTLDVSTNIALTELDCVYNN